VLQLAAGTPSALMLTSPPGIRDVTIDGIIFDGNKDNQAVGGDGILLMSSHFAHITHIKVQNFHGSQPSGAGLHLQGAESPLVEQSFFVDNGIPGQTQSDGLFVSGFGAHVIGNFAFGNTDTGFATQNSHDLIFEQNVAEHCGNGFGGGSPSYHLTYRNNTSQFNLFGFTFCPCRLNRAPAVHDVTLDSNQIQGNSEAGIWVSGTALDRPSAFTLKNNSVTGTSGPGSHGLGANGILLQETDLSILQENTVSKNDNHGVMLQGSTSITISENNIFDNSQLNPCTAFGIFVSDDSLASSNGIAVIMNQIFDDQSPPTQAGAVFSASHGSLVEQGNQVFGNCQ